MNHVDQVRKRGINEAGQARIIILALAFFFMGVVVSALWFSREPSAQAASKAALPGNAILAQPDSSVLVPDPTAVSAHGDLQPQHAPQADPAALEAVKRSIPNVNSASLEAGTRILREAALAEFQQTVQELQARLEKAQKEFIQGQKNQSDEQQQMATKQLRELQAEQMEKLKQIAAASKAQIDAFQQLKEAPR